MSWLPARRITIGSRIFLGYGVIMALALGFMVVVVSLLVDAHATQVQALERRQRLETSALRLNLALEQESGGVRGYLLQGNEDYLQPYREAILLHQAALDDLQRLVATPEDQAALSRVRERYDAFLIGAE